MTMTNELNERVQSLLAERVAAGEEIGLQAAAYHNGELIVDAWAGVADETTGQPVDGDTLFTSWSTTKGFAATCLHILADRGLIDYDAPVARYWPEFGRNGKTAVTVRHALTHRAGVPQMPANVTPEMMTDWDAMCNAIAVHEPLWEPGTKTGYHAWTIGWIWGEIVRRVDGRSLARFAQEELCLPLGITDFYLGIPTQVETRVARLRQDEQHTANTENATGLNRLAGPPHVSTAEVVNRPDIRRASIPGGGGIMNARAVARHYAMLAGYGQLDGVRILSAERIDLMRALQTDAHDQVLDRPIRKGLGYFLGGDEAQGGNAIMGGVGGEFGHPGNGGSIGFADPERQFAFGLTKNYMRTVPARQQSTAYLVAETIRNELDRA